jgi:hypothetical protein
MITLYFHRDKMPERILGEALALPERRERYDTCLLVFHPKPLASDFLTPDSLIFRFTALLTTVDAEGEAPQRKPFFVWGGARPKTFSPQWTQRVKPRRENHFWEPRRPWHSFFV